MITLEIMYQNTILLQATQLMPQPSNCLNFLSFHPSEYLISCLVFSRKINSFIKVFLNLVWLSFYMKAEADTGPF